MKKSSLQTDTEFLNYIIERLQEAGVVCKNQEELFALLVPNEPWQKYKKSWYHWRAQKVQSLRKSKHIKEAIAKTLHFHPSIWDGSISEKKRALQRGIKLFKKSKNIDISDILPKDAPPTKKQLEVLEAIKNLPSSKIRDYLLEYPQFLTKSSQNQSYLLELLNYLYRLACYDLLEELIFPALLPYNRGSNAIKIIEAHTLGSLSKPKFIESAKLLDSVVTTNNLQEIDIKTAAISNLKRAKLLNLDITKEELKTLLAPLIKHYYELYSFNKEYHYYPAVNLLYLLTIVESIFGKECKLLIANSFEIAYNTKPSLEKDKKSSNLDTKYYAFISELEMQMLLGDKDIATKFEFLIEHLHPSQDNLKRTLRQINHSIALIEKFASNAPLSHIKSVQKLLEDAIEYFKTPHRS